MQFEDHAIILKTQSFSDSKLLLTVLTANHGIYKGIFRCTKKQRAQYMAGSKITFSWQARLAEHLGQITAEMETPYTAMIMQMPHKLGLLQALCIAMEQSLMERMHCGKLYTHFETFMAQFSGDDWHEAYSYLMQALLIESGYALTFSRCALGHGCKHPSYISPKTGNAVCEEHAQGYQEKCFAIPNKNATNVVQYHYENARIYHYFLDKWVLAERNIKTMISFDHYYKKAFSITKKTGIHYETHAC